MKRRTCLGLLGGALIVPFVASIPNSIAQSSGDQATVSALQTQVSVLQTKAALQTQVATLQVQVAGRNASTPSSTARTKPLYEANWSQGANGWNGGESWSVVNGILTNTGEGRSTVRPPFRPPVPDYAVESEIRAIRPVGCDTFFGIFARASASGALATECAFCNGSWMGQRLVAGSGAVQAGMIDKIASTAFEPGADWHTYRLEVAGEDVRVIIDGAMLIEASDLRYRDPGAVGLIASQVQLEVRSFKILAL